MRVMVVGTGSGCGKTTVTCVILKRLMERKMDVRSFKCGPDYIDPMLHSSIIGKPSRNLDIFLCGENATKYLLAKNGGEISVVEGVMGMYDGSSSSNDISLLTNTPQILVVDARGKGESIVAEVSGYLNYKSNNIKGIVINNARGDYAGKLLKEKLGLRIVGKLDFTRSAVIGSRRLGLDTENIVDKLNTLPDGLDIDAILDIASTAEELTYEPYDIEPLYDVTIGVAKDEAFCFHYQDNLDLLSGLGAKIVYFSPVHDTKLPDVDGLIFGGGYPENYRFRLAVETKVPIIAEGGGFMYLAPKLGVDVHMTDALVRFGYITLTAKYDNLLCRQGEKISAHEFHHSDTNNNGNSFIARKTNGKTWECIHADENSFIGYPHLHFYSNIEMARRFLKKCQENKENKMQ